MPPPNDRRRGTLGPNELGLMIAVLAVVVFTAAADADHDYLTNPVGCARQVLLETSLLATFALGSAIVIITGGIDLSAGSMIAFSASVCASIMLVLAPEGLQDPNVPVGAGVIVAAVVGTLAVGFLVGSFHAWLITVVRLPPFIATLATLVGLRSFARWLVKGVTAAVSGSEKAQIVIFDESFRSLGTSYVIAPLVCLVLVVGCAMLMRWTIVGRHLYAIGGNEEAARLSGIRTDGMKWFAYCASAMLSSVAGILYAGYAGRVNPEMLGMSQELNGIAAAMVGGCSLQGGVGTILGTLLGCLFLRCVFDSIGRIITSGATIYEGMIVGLLVVVAVAFNQLRQAGAARKRFFAGPLGLVMIFTLALLAVVVGG
ncbi:MAG: ABC transporter permease, partial [Candidatus Nealsonbacteria bacterium]|nr:ABC transporter permease [Candidatus Nealsonbacteria bacterium]